MISFNFGLLKSFGKIWNFQDEALADSVSVCFPVLPAAAVGPSVVKVEASSAGRHLSQNIRVKINTLLKYVFI